MIKLKYETATIKINKVTDQVVVESTFKDHRHDIGPFNFNEIERFIRFYRKGFNPPHELQFRIHKDGVSFDGFFGLQDDANGIADLSNAEFEDFIKHFERVK